MPKHTPGPWAIGLDSDDERVQVIAATGEHIAYVECDPVWENASLMAKAPELLAAATRLTEHLLDELEHPLPAWLDYAVEKAEILRSIIEKRKVLI